MNISLKWPKYKQHIIVITFFVIFLLAGLSVYKDYGVGCDEGNNRHYGQLVII